MGACSPTPEPRGLMWPGSISIHHSDVACCVRMFGRTSIAGWQQKNRHRQVLTCSQYTSPVYLVPVLCTYWPEQVRGLTRTSATLMATTTIYTPFPVQVAQAAGMSPTFIRKPTRLSALGRAWSRGTSERPLTFGLTITLLTASMARVTKRLCLQSEFLASLLGMIRPFPSSFIIRCIWFTRRSACASQASLLLRQLCTPCVWAAGICCRCTMCLSGTVVCHEQA